MERHYYTQYSEHLQREMHVLVYGYTGVPIIVFHVRTVCVTILRISA